MKTTILPAATRLCCLSNADNMQQTLVEFGALIRKYLFYRRPWLTVEMYGVGEAGMYELSGHPKGGVMVSGEEDRIIYLSGEDGYFDLFHPIRSFVRESPSHAVFTVVDIVVEVPAL